MRLASCLVFMVWAVAGVAQGEERPLRMPKPLELTEGWGTIEGQFVLEGDSPASRPPIPNPVIAGGPAIPDERLLVDSETNGIANIVVYLRKPAAVHPALKQSKKAVVDFTLDNARFKPHLLHVRTDQTVRCSSLQLDNLRTNPFRNEAANVMVGGQLGDVEITMKHPEILPIDVKSDQHPWMQSYWVVTDHPYVGITDEKGRFRIEGLPAGQHAFTVWHEQVGYIDRAWAVEVRSKQSVDLPAVKVPVSKLKKLE